MNEAASLAVRLAFLALLWLFVLSAVRAVRADLFGPTRRQQRRSSAARPPAPPPPPRSPRRGKTPTKLVVTAGALRGTTIPLGSGAVTIGRAGDSSLVLEDDFASAHHARLVPSDGQWLVEDLGSTNGTYLDRSKGTRPTPVPVRGPARIGKAAMELRR